MNNGARRAGATLPELLLLLSLLAVLGGMGVSASAGALDRVSVRGARDAVATTVGRARTLARLHGSARIQIDAATGTLRLESPIGSTSPVANPIGDAFGVEISIDGGVTSPVTLDFDALGLGRLANRTLRFRRNGAEARLTLSSYGRPRRW